MNRYIYNADPSAPRYNDYFTVSKFTGYFQACAGKSNRDECGCTDAQKWSSTPTDTDCMQHVVRWYFNEEFKPEIMTFMRNKPLELLEVPYKIREINGRIDWCFQCKDIT
jgi:hypothetical protein